MAKKKPAGPQEQGTQERIRRAAMHEFSEQGLSGARVERIARAANVNIRMIYYFFGSKKGLLEEVLREIFMQRRAQLVSRYDNVADLLASYFDGYAEDSQRVRLLQWEALQTRLPEAAAQLTNFADRQTVIDERIASIVDLQKRGIIPANLEPKLLYLMFVALAIYPMTFPQSVFIATGEHAAGKDFKKKYRESLRQLANTLFPAEPTAVRTAVKSRRKQITTKKR
jgi:AcrR family transcriptional regulator